MFVYVIGPDFSDILCHDLFEMGMENSVRLTSERGGINRLIEKKIAKPYAKYVVFEPLGVKNSVILTFGGRKTTLTDEKKFKILLSSNVCSDDVVYVAYAEDLDWGSLREIGLSDAKLLIDFSGRFKNSDQISSVISTARTFFSKVYVCLTDHDPVTLQDCRLWSTRLSASIIHHTPRELQFFDAGAHITVANNYFVKLPYDLVGYGDYLALRTSVQLLLDEKLTKDFFIDCQKEIGRDIDEFAKSSDYTNGGSR